MILHYSLAIWKINDNALALIFFVNAQRSVLHTYKRPLLVIRLLPVVLGGISDVSSQVGSS